MTNSMQFTDLKREDFECPQDRHPRAHSYELDQKLGLDVLAIEERLYQGDPNDHQYSSRAWMGLPFQTLQTPYHEILELLLKLKSFNPKKIVDFGAAYGRVGIVSQVLFPESEFLGLEMVEERVSEGKRVFSLLGLNPKSLKVANIVLPQFEIPQADVYFVYDFSDPQDLAILLDKLCQNLFEKRFFLIAKGKAINSLIQMKYRELYACYGRLWVGESVIYSSFTEVEAL